MNSENCSSVNYTGRGITYCPLGIKNNKQMNLVNFNMPKTNETGALAPKQTIQYFQYESRPLIRIGNEWRDAN